ncbi:globin C, coelomic-like [Daphnia pulicaria]|uniref:globin C, coelomic-like n=1 Tax=Daphnia pulicaria TaxID=35523 RepID=UPI001EEAA6F0|nr:globin C, coelomic-like [Daphnia pulicaria]
MSMFILVLCAVLSLSAGQSILFKEGTQGPFVMTTTVTTTFDFNAAGVPRARSSACDRTNYDVDKKYGSLSQMDIDIIANSWNILKKRGNFAPKVFIRYFKAKPESQKLFPAIANVSITDLPTNHDFLNSAFTCVNSLNYLIPYLKNDHPERCPSFPKQIKDNYNEVDVKKLGSIWMMAMQEEMGSDFTNDVRDAWKKAVMAVIEYVSK